ncbi:MAG: acyl carrier protein [SAR324 cluster bacterium]|nr:acyl carrier protein [SAR324 cluster bacterium]
MTFLRGPLRQKKWRTYILSEILKKVSKKMEKLIAELKKKIIEELSLEDLTPENIQDDEPLFGGGLGLDSIDALSLVVVLDKEYGIQIEDPEQGKDILYSIKTIAQHITDNR